MDQNHQSGRSERPARPGVNLARALAHRRTPRDEGFRMPAEWAPHAACWLAWPSHAELWKTALPAARRSFVRLCEALAVGERLEILVPDAAQQRQAEAALVGIPARFHPIPFGDIWLRDTAPLFTTNGTGGTLAVCFDFNGWGEKYLLPHDDGVAEAVAQAAAVPSCRAPLILEGGSIDVDGAGTALTTRQCLLHPARNPQLSEADLEAALGAYLGIERVLWLEDGLRNDHTDGHVDTLARFVAPGVVACMEPAADDPNRDALRAILARLRESRDARGRRLEVVTVPSPGAVVDEAGQLLPASYVNFLIGNRAVVVPTYGAPRDEAAVAAIAPLFPGRLTVGVPARSILSGGGAFHCITQQQPVPWPAGGPP